METVDAEDIGAELVVAEHRPGATIEKRTPPPHEQLAALFLLSKKNPNTRNAYQRDLTEWFSFCARFGIDPLYAEQHHFDLWRDHLTNGRHQTRYGTKQGYPPSTVARRLAAVSSFYRYCVRNHRAIVPANPVEHVERPVVDDESMTQGLDLDEARRLLAAAEAAGPRAHALIALMLHCGLRVSEACAANCGSLGRDDKGPLIRVKRKRGKTQKVPMPAAVAQVVNAYAAGRRGPLFIDDDGDRMTRQQVAYMLKSLLRAAGLDTGITPHGLRHTAVTLLRDAGEDIEDVAALMGHASLNTTKRYDRHYGRRSTVDALAKYLHDGEPPKPSGDLDRARAVAQALGLDPDTVDLAAVAAALEKGTS